MSSFIAAVDKVQPQFSNLSAADQQGSTSEGPFHHWQFLSAAWWILAENSSFLNMALYTLYNRVFFFFVCIFIPHIYMQTGFWVTNNVTLWNLTESVLLELCQCIIVQTFYMSCSCSPHGLHLGPSDGIFCCIASTLCTSVIFRRNSLVVACTDAAVQVEPVLVFSCRPAFFSLLHVALHLEIVSSFLCLPCTWSELTFGKLSQMWMRKNYNIVNVHRFFSLYI